MHELFDGPLQRGLKARIHFHVPSFTAGMLCTMCFFLFIAPQRVRAQVAPGPYEILPFDDGCIIEGFRDMDLRTDYIADWTGYAYYTGGGWYLESPHPYDGHTGTDFSVQTGTALHASAAGIVSGLYTNYTRNTYANDYGNYVRISVGTRSTNSELLDLIYCHMLSLTVTNGQHVNAGDLVGYSDNTGQSDSEHVHFMTELRAVTNTCPFYWGHFKYPIMFNPTGTIQVGRVIKVTATNTPIRADRFDTSTQLITAWQNQLYFSAYAKRGYYQVFIPNNGSYRAGFIKATDVGEVFDGTVVQPLPDNVWYTPAVQLANKYSIRSAPSDSAAQIGQILFGGTRFVADQVSGSYYRIPLPGPSATWGWVKPDSRMIVYPQLANPSLNLSLLPNNNFSIRESFTTVTNRAMFGRPKFNRSVVKPFSPTSPGGDGKVLFVTDATNAGSGTTESATVGKPGHRNYYIQCNVYFAYQPSYLVGSDFERYGVFLRDDGFAGLDTTYEGAGNSYALMWDCDDGRLRAGKLVDGTWTDFQPTAKYVTGSGWHTLRIEAKDTQIRYYLDGTLLVQVNDSSFPCGVCGVGYSWHTYNSSYPSTRGACFDNFVADTLDTNRPPTAANLTAGTRMNQPIGIPVEKLLLFASDPDSDLLSVSSVSLNSTNGGRVVLGTSLVIYTPATNFIGTDRFAYTVVDGRGGSAAAAVVVQVRSSGPPSGSNMLTPTPIPGGWLVGFAGIPGRTYTLQRAEGLDGPWFPLAAITVGSGGIATYADTNAPSSDVYYRTVYP
jgi:hypothetical protein